MADCGICLNELRSPVSVPCGHVHCETCLRSHINSGADALRSWCPTCRKSFHIATPDLTFVPPKYHDFILPSVRKVFMDIPSVLTMTRDMDALNQRLDSFAKESERLRERCARYTDRLGALEAESRALIEQEAEARQETLDLRKKYDVLKKKYREVQSRDNESRRSSQNYETSREILPKVEEHPVSLEDLSPDLPRPKRALPKTRLSNSMRCKDETTSQFVKRQRTHRYSDVGPSSQLLTVVFKDEDEEEE